MKTHLVTAALLAAALVCYVSGFKAGTIAFTTAGLIFESMFWFRLLRRSKA